MIKAALIGATGRMGAAIVRACAAGGEVEIVAAVASPGSKSLGRDVGELAGIAALGVRVLGDLPPDLGGAQVAIDFSRPDLSLRALNVCRAARVPIVIGTTGHGAEFDARVAAAARDIAVLVAPNTSIGVAVARELVRIAAAGAARGLRHRDHRGAPQAQGGCAVGHGTGAGGQRGQGARPRSARRYASGPRRPGRAPPGEIGIASVRAGDIVGTHTVLFAGTGERLTVGHEATDRSVFAQGAVRAAAWLAAQKPGRYTMAHVLGLKTSS